MSIGTTNKGVIGILTGGGDELPPPKMERGLVKVKGIAVDLQGDPRTGGMAFTLTRGF